MASSKKPSAAGPATQGLKVIARPQAGFRRAGRFFSAEGTVIPLSEITSEEVDVLKGESMLICVDVDMPADKT
jgi:hypothetical protein